MKRDAFTLPLPQTVAVLFARADSTYKTLPGTDVWDIERDAKLWPGGTPVVAHPPCRAWGRLRKFAKPRKGERQLAIWSVRQVRRFGGVLEHPVGSLLWKKAGLPPPGQVDRYGGWTLPIHQNWWGHRAEKATLLYIVGCAPANVPPIPMRLGEATHVVQSRKRIDHRPHITKAEREHTPAELAQWLCELARRCGAGKSLLANLAEQARRTTSMTTLSTQQVLDPCCGSRMMWFDKQDPRAIFGDQRSESHVLCDGRQLHIAPDLQMDFRALPFADGSFHLVVFDPPHLKHAGPKSWLRAKYGVLGENWRDDLRQGFDECFRVLASNGTLIFKWAEDQVKVREVLELAPVPPLFGHPTGRKGLTHWMVFMKPAQE